jgi:hypothetical protein
VQYDIIGHPQAEYQFAVTFPFHPGTEAAPPSVTIIREYCQGPNSVLYNLPTGVASTMRTLPHQLPRLNIHVLCTAPVRLFTLCTCGFHALAPAVPPLQCSRSARAFALAHWRKRRLQCGQPHLGPRSKGVCSVSACVEQARV